MDGEAWERLVELAGRPNLRMGFGIFNLAEGIIDHQILGIHHVNETVAHEYWIYWDTGFLIWGAAMLIGGWFLLKTGEQQTPPQPSAATRFESR